jgi:peptidoglycan/xylan/chitin deacetylase (PgdA/CDA1 family)
MKPLLLLVAVFSLNTVHGQSKDTAQAVTIYLTFDDGPMKASSHLLDAIEKDSVPVTVFLVGRRASANATNSFTLERYRNNPLFEIANHSFTHADGKYKWYYSHPQTVIDDILYNDDCLALSNKMVRLPGRNVWRLNGRRRHDLADAAPAADSLAAKGYTIFGWDMEWCYDTSGKSNYSASHMMEQLYFIARHGNSFIKDHIVILCHDPMLLNPVTRKEFELFLAQVKADSRLQLALLSGYPGYSLLARH